MCGGEGEREEEGRGSAFDEDICNRSFSRRTLSRSRGSGSSKSQLCSRSCSRMLRDIVHVTSESSVLHFLVKPKAFILENVSPRPRACASFRKVDVVSVLHKIPWGRHGIGHGVPLPLPLQFQFQDSGRTWYGQCQRFEVIRTMTRLRSFLNWPIVFEERHVDASDHTSSIERKIGSWCYPCERPFPSLWFHPVKLFLLVRISMRTAGSALGCTPFARSAEIGGCGHELSQADMSMGTALCD